MSTSVAPPHDGATTGLLADGVELGDGVARKYQLGGGDVLAQVGDGRGAGDQHHGRRPLQEPGESQLLPGGAEAVRDSSPAISG